MNTASLYRHRSWTVGRIVGTALVAGATLNAVAPPTWAAPPQSQLHSATQLRQVEASQWPIREITRATDAADGVKGTFVNRTKTTFTLDISEYADYRTTEIASFDVHPGERFDYVIGQPGSFDSKPDLYLTASSPQDWTWIKLSDPTASWPESTIEHLEWEHSVGDVNRADGQPPWDIAVERQADGNQGLTGETEDTEDWANFDVYLDDHDATIDKSFTAVSNRTDRDVLVRSFRSGQATGPAIALAPGKAHEFAFVGEGNVVKVYDPKVSVTNPVGELGYRANRRQKPITVVSTFGTGSGATASRSSRVRLHRDAHLDADDSKTYVSRWEKHRPGERSNDTATLLFELHTISRNPM